MLKSFFLRGTGSEGLLPRGARVVMVLLCSRTYEPLLRILSRIGSEGKPAVAAGLYDSCYCDTGC